MVITTAQEVRKVGQIGTEYDDTEILAEIDIVEAIYYDKYTLPKRSSFVLDPLYTTFYFSELPVIELLRVQVQVDTSVSPSGYINIGSPLFTHVVPNNYIVASPTLMTSYTSKSVRCQYIPKIYSRMVALQVALNLINGTTIVNGAKVESPLSSRLKDQLNDLKDQLKPKGIRRSSEFETFDKYDYIAIDQVSLR